MPNQSGLKAKLKQYWPLYIMFIPCAVMLVIFNYYPMYGIVLAFKDYFIKLGIMGSPFAEDPLVHFKELFSDPYFMQVTGNTLRISALRLLCGFPAPIFLALLFNEIRGVRFKKTVQTVLYLPYFLSWVVLGGMFKTIFMNDGLINTWLGNLGIGPIPFLSDPQWFLAITIITDIWKNMGFSSIIYLAAISGIDGEQYEAAMIDGANRWQRVRYITLPGLVPAISIQLILSLSGVLNAGFDQIFNMYSPVVYSTADIIDTYVYRIGLGDGNYEIATALGLFKSVIGFVLILITNKAIKKTGGEGIW